MQMLPLRFEVAQPKVVLRYGLASHTHPGTRPDPLRGEPDPVRSLQEIVY